MQNLQLNKWAKVYFFIKTKLPPIFGSCACSLTHYCQFSAAKFVNQSRFVHMGVCVCVVKLLYFLVFCEWCAQINSVYFGVTGNWWVEQYFKWIRSKIRFVSAHLCMCLCVWKKLYSFSGVELYQWNKKKKLRSNLNLIMHIDVCF